MKEPIPHASATHAARCAARPASRSRLLVIEDDASSQTLLARLLESEGYDVRTAGDGGRGLELTQQFRPHVVICDWIMPGLDGIGYCRRVKSDPDLRPTYVTLLSGRGDSRDRVAGLDAGADDFLAKPFAADELRARVRAGLRVRRLQQELSEAQHRAAVLEMAATLGHEINNPLTALFGHMELVLQYLERGDVDRMQHHIREAGEVAARIGQVARSLHRMAEPRTIDYLDGLKMLDLESVP